MAGRFGKLIGTAQGHPVVGAVSLASTGAFVVGVAIGIVKAISADLPLWNLLMIVIPVGVLAVALSWLYYQSVKPTPPAAVAPEPIPTPTPPLSLRRFHRPLDQRSWSTTYPLGLDGEKMGMR
jgi:hypothetical protein